MPGQVLPSTNSWIVLCLGNIGDSPVAQLHTRRLSLWLESHGKIPPEMEENHTDPIIGMSVNNNGIPHIF